MNCIICERKIGSFMEDKLILESGKECCYQCAPLIRNIEGANNSNLFFSRLDELIKKMDSSSTNYEIREMLETNFREIAIARGYSKEVETFCPVCGLPLKRTDTSCPREVL